ncbi:MAG: hypothetical protein U9R75_05600 [Candidatus Thermoplasmatota archaeon]|nr:hypothetical protein [Candidatus Thermoplasmatota archaeon]
MTPPIGYPLGTYRQQAVSLQQSNTVQQDAGQNLPLTGDENGLMRNSLGPPG